jgi:hypothetical protein
MPAPSLVSYLKGIQMLRRMHPEMGAPASWRYASAEDFLLEKGKGYASAALTPGELRVLKDALDAYGGQCRQQRCFYNSALVALADPSHELRYTEGYTISARAPIPIQHAWLTLNNKVIDPTIRVGKQKGVKRRFWADRVVGTFEDAEFFGIEFPNEYVRRFLVETRQAGSMIFDYTRDLPLLSGKLSI